MSVEIGGCPNCRVSNVIVVTGNKARLQPIEEDSHAIFANALCGGGRLEQADEGRTGTRDGGLYSLQRGTDEGGRPEGLDPPAAEFGCDDSTSREWQTAGAGWPVCGVERADRWLLSYRRGRSGCGDLLGIALPGRKSRCRRGASILAHAGVSCAAR